MEIRYIQEVTVLVLRIELMGIKYIQEVMALMSLIE
jgi:hypothetical protein